MEPERSGEGRSSDHGGDREDPSKPGDDGEPTGTDETAVGESDETNPEGVASATEGSTVSSVPAAESISVDELFELLSHPGNRYILTYVIRSDGPVPYADLVEYVVDEGGTPDDLETAEFRNQIATRLVHSNLPKLDDAGLVYYDVSNKTIRETSTTEVAVPYLELAMEQSLRD